jgi:hypothetical protein
MIDRDFTDVSSTREPGHVTAAMLGQMNGYQAVRRGKP